MSARCSLVVNGKAVRVSTGDTPLETAVADGVIAPTQAMHGTALLGQAPAPQARRSQPRMRRAETAKPVINPQSALADMQTSAAAAEPPVPVVSRKGSVTKITRLGPHVVQVVVTLNKRLVFEPGHLVTVTPEGALPVTLSPTLRVDGSAELNELVFHLTDDGASGSDGPTEAGPFRLGQEVGAKGPTGRGYYRPGGGRLVLVADETGFAPIWAIARAARYIEPARGLSLVVGARDALDLYMRPSLDWLKATGVSRITMVSDRSGCRPPDVRPGPLTAHIPSLHATDIVHVCGSASTVGAVEVLAAAVGARCYPTLLG